MKKSELQEQKNKLAAKITRSNKRLAKMKPKEKRVAIAKDVIKMIAVKLISPLQGSYVYTEDWESREQLQTEIVNLPQCETCALGALFTQHVIVNNNCTVFEAAETGSSSIKVKLKGIFSQIQLELIECAFEKSTSFCYSADYYKSEKAVEFGRQYFYSEDRLIAIMKNIIDNKGTFKP